MLIFAMDDEELMLEELTDAIQKAQPEAEVRAFRRSSELLNEMTEHKRYPEIAFLDIETPGMSGVELAKRIKQYSPLTNIIFATGYSEYAVEAHRLHVSGYVLKPVTEEAVKRELAELRHPVPQSDDERVKIKTFGHFEIFVDDEPVKFAYSKTKELLALLVDRNGAFCTSREAVAALWENEEDLEKKNTYIKRLRADLSTTLDRLECVDIIEKKRGMLCILPKKVSCDYYDWLKGLPYAINAYQGEYMSQYSWGEARIEHFKEK
ncbi:MAG: response regulator [bacterium]|nr:response regulator [bacterium]